MIITNCLKKTGSRHGFRERRVVWQNRNNQPKSLDEFGKAKTLLPESRVSKREGAGSSLAWVKNFLAQRGNEIRRFIEELTRNLQAKGGGNMVSQRKRHERIQLNSRDIQFDTKSDGTGGESEKILDDEDIKIISPEEADGIEYEKNLEKRFSEIYMELLENWKNSYSFDAPNGERKRGSPDERVLKLLMEQAKVRLDLELHQIALARETRGKMAALELATKDALTGLGNRAAYEAEKEAQYALAKRHGKPLSVVLFDYDNFKKLNDTYGHAAGDEAIRFIGEALRAEGVLRVSDKSFRQGGEEFAIFLPETDSEGAIKVAERIREFVENNASKRVKAFLESQGNEELAEKVGVISISMGISSLNGQTSCEELVEEADRALYYSKENGRNQAHAFEEINKKSLDQKESPGQTLEPSAALQTAAGTINESASPERPTDSGLMKAEARKIVEGLSLQQKNQLLRQIEGLLPENPEERRAVLEQLLQSGAA